MSSTRKRPFETVSAFRADVILMTANVINYFMSKVQTNCLRRFLGNCFFDIFRIQSINFIDVLDSVQYTFTNHWLKSIKFFLIPFNIHLYDNII